MPNHSSSGVVAAAAAAAAAAVSDIAPVDVVVLGMLSDAEILDRCLVIEDWQVLPSDEEVKSEIIGLLLVEDLVEDLEE